MSKTTLRGVLREQVWVRSRRPYKTLRQRDEQKQARNEWAVEVEEASGTGNGNFDKVDINRVRFSDGSKWFAESLKNRVWVTGDDDPRLRIAGGEKSSRCVMAALAVPKCGGGKLVFNNNDHVIDGNAYEMMMRKDVIPDIRFKMRAHPEPHTWWRQQDFAPTRACELRMARSSAGASWRP